MTDAAAAVEPDPGVPESAVPGSAVVDAAVPGSAVVDAAVPGSAVVDAAVPGSVVVDEVAPGPDAPPAVTPTRRVRREAGRPAVPTDEAAPSAESIPSAPTRRDARLLRPTATPAEPATAEAVEADAPDFGQAPDLGPPPGAVLASDAVEAPDAAQVSHGAHVWPAPSSSAVDAAPGEPSTVERDAGMAASELPPVDESPSGTAAASSPGTPAARPRGASTESIPDQIAPRRPAPAVDRPPAPIVYQPVASSYIGAMRPPLPEARPRNVPAIASIVLLALAAIGGLAVVLWLARWDQTIAGLVSLVSVAFAAGAFFLAVGGLIVAGQRRTGRVMSAVALAVSIVLVAWLVIVATEQALAILA
jgi:hypothetical protein